jgi:hypothetical protein
MEQAIKVLSSAPENKEIMVGDVRIFIDDVGYHLTNGEKQKTVHWVSHLPEAMKSFA